VKVSLIKWKPVSLCNLKKMYTRSLSFLFGLRSASNDNIPRDMHTRGVMVWEVR
jgi:hypothetical protein